VHVEGDCLPRKKKSTHDKRGSQSASIGEVQKSILKKAQSSSGGENTRSGKEEEDRGPRFTKLLKKKDRRPWEKGPSLTCGKAAKKIRTGQESGSIRKGAVR